MSKIAGGKVRNANFLYFKSLAVLTWYKKLDFGIYKVNFL